MEQVFITVSSKGQMVIPAAIREELGIKRLRKKAETGVKCLKSIPQGLKPVLYFEAFAARLKSCPVTKLLNTPPILSFSAACKAPLILLDLCGG
jgi:DNA-binding transcriptional regulator/RsmH inhibitor MraZ